VYGQQVIGPSREERPVTHEPKSTEHVEPGSVGAARTRKSFLKPAKFSSIEAAKPIVDL
jgi:hypothetical protein